MNYFNVHDNLFVIKKNEKLYIDLCDKLKTHQFESPWKMCFIDNIRDENLFCGVYELSFKGTRGKQLRSSNLSREQQTSFVRKEKHLDTDSAAEIDEFKLKILEKSIKQSLKSFLTEDLRGIDLLCTIHPAQVPTLCSKLENVLSNDVALALFLNAILGFKKPLSLSIASALANCIIYPQVFGINRRNVSRNLLASVFTFSDIYPKAAVDGLVVPYLKQTMPETLQIETILKMTKSILPNECVAYGIKSIIEETLPIENTFCALQTFIERKIHHEPHLHKVLAWKAENWSTAWNKNVKFTKLLISILSVYGSELEEECFLIYENVLRHNETIMKKAVENVLKKLNRPS